MANWSDTGPERVRREYDLEQLDESSLPGDPLLLFKVWLEVAAKSGNIDSTAMTLSTVDESGAPSSRIVLLKKIDHNKLIGNYLKDNPSFHYLISASQ